MDEKELATLRTLFVKLKPIFLSDVYIIKGRYVISGKKSSNEIAGNYLCILEDKYSELIKKMYGNHEIIYISDLIKIKNEIDLWFEIIISEKEKESIYHNLTEILDTIDSIETWNSLEEDYPELTNTIFKEKHNYSMSVNTNNEDVIVVGKSSFPSISEKAMTKVSYNVTYLTELVLYRLVLKYNHSHFQLFMNYFAIPMVY